MKFSVCISAVFNGKEFIESMKAIKNVGIDTFEFWSWWDMDLDAIQRAKKEFGMNVFAFCTKFASLTDSTKRQEYISSLKESIKAAQKLECSALIAQVGNELPEIPRQEQHKSIVEGLEACVPVLEEAGITLLFEPLNTLIDHKGYYLYSADEAFQIADEVGSQRVKVLYDIYHQQVMNDNLISKITSNIDKIGHFHAAGNPGRHELNIGEINYKNIFAAINDAGYKGYIGLEYFPVKDPVEGLKALMR